VVQRRDKSAFFMGYSGAREGTLRIEAWDPLLRSWSQIATARSASSPDPNGGGATLYQWQKSLQIPRRHWEAPRLNLSPGETGRASALLRVKDDLSGQNYYLGTFNEEGFDCLYRAVVDERLDYFNAGMRCGTGNTLTLLEGRDAIVIPVHVHVLASRSDALPHPRVSREVWESYVRRWLDPTRSEIDQFSEEQLVPPDATWEQAGIQLHRASYEVIRSDGLDRWLLTDDELEGMNDRVRPCGPSRLKALYEGEHRGEPGLHLYLGGQLGDEQPLAANEPVALGALARKNYGFACGPNCGRAASGTPNFIAIDAGNFPLAWDRMTNVLGHELGHYLGIAHTNETESCGAPLVESGTPTPNLMVRGMGVAPAYLSNAQIERARDVACQWLSVWGVASPACS
jgi:hypothetical protein